MGGSLPRRRRLWHAEGGPNPVDQAQPVPSEEAEAMPTKYVRLIASAALCAAWALLTLPGGAAAQGKGPKKLPRLLTAKPLDTAAESDDLRQLFRARYNAALDEVRVRYHQFQSGGGNLAPLLDAYRRLLAAGVAVADT